MKKTPAELIDELAITNNKIFTLMQDGEDLVKIKRLNLYRSELKNAINEYFDERTEIKV